MVKLRPVILCGGSGTRLWPVSRANYPKHLARLGGSRSLLQQTLQRVSGPMFSAPVLVTAEDQRFLISDQLQDLGIASACIILEQVARNTAPALGAAAKWLELNCPGEVMLVLPSDHRIADEDAFRQALVVAGEAAEKGNLVTLGVTPDRPETGFGYQQIASDGGDGAPVKVLRFVEKPDKSQAEEYLASGDYVWNAGIFVFQAATFLQELARHAPPVAQWSDQAVTSGEADGAFFRPQEDAAIDCPAISVDYAVMERTDRLLAVPVDMGWSDLGSWDAVWEHSPKDDNANALSGDVLALQTSGTLVFADGRTSVATLGVDDLVVVATGDAVLVAHRDKVQNVRDLVSAMAAEGWTQSTDPKVMHRPWGTYETTDRDTRFQTKRIIVKPGAKLSQQLHHHRSEHWIVVSGTAEVTVGEDTFLLFENQSTYISAGTVHRLGNPGKVPLHLVEVQCGSYLNEDDIVRIDDVYGREKRAT